jgi:BON domain-containing protein
MKHQADFDSVPLRTAIGRISGREAIALGIGLAIPALAQDISPPVPAGTRCTRRRGHHRAVKNAYTGTVTAAKDTTITTKVKAAFAGGKDIGSNDIHVTTTACVVTLDGKVPEC